MGGQITDGRVWGGLIPSRTLGDFWDKSAERKGSGLYAEDKAPKPAVATLEKLFGEEWRTEYTHSLDSQGAL